MANLSTPFWRSIEGHLTVNKTDAVRKTNTPCFCAREGTAASGATLIFTVVELNVGGCYNNANGRFTCTVPGVYFFECFYLTNAAAGHGWFRKNGTVLYYSHSNRAQYDMGHLIQTLNLVAGDYVDIWNNTGYTVVPTSIYNSFCGYLVGQ